MEKVGKIKTIYRAFTKQSDIDPKILEKRREICNSCDFNSKNKEDKGLFNEIRSNVIKEPFCTACGCQIKQKTASETEVCGAVYFDLKPKWNRIKVETMDKTDLNIINLSPDKINVDLDVSGEHFVIDCGEVDMFSTHAYKILVEGKEEGYKLLVAEPSCHFCTTVERETQDAKRDVLNVTFNLSAETQGVGVSKNVFLFYDSSQGRKKTYLEFRFFPK